MLEWAVSSLYFTCSFFDALALDHTVCSMKHCLVGEKECQMERDKREMPRRERDLGIASGECKRGEIMVRYGRMRNGWNIQER